ncbi:hypothetical protein FA95DRAFT_1610610 [Auriscalpium vulgare]|uniref:Uncharacterized protein n=1 Tax=Auriscalpium vulgare TaxID=40419 RepID=A0ACB8RE90_9AGAM|nr:hypothetical protein FA95DRAFT_1610610 [Auriscalpium vulgare]
MRFVSFTALATLAVLASFVHTLPMPVDERTIEELNVRQCPWLKRSPCTKEENN